MATDDNDKKEVVHMIKEMEDYIHSVGESHGLPPKDQDFCDNYRKAHDNCKDCRYEASCSASVTTLVNLLGATLGEDPGYDICEDAERNAMLASSGIVPILNPPKQSSVFNEGDENGKE